jgi:hypothetical protein
LGKIKRRELRIITKLTEVVTPMSPSISIALIGSDQVEGQEQKGVKIHCLLSSFLWVEFAKFHLVIMK